MKGRLRLRRDPGGYLAKFTDARVHGAGKSKRRKHGCRICVNEMLFDNLYEFARARELLGTTDISYNQFILEYVHPVFGATVAPKRTLLKCLDEHVRPALRREAFVYELERAQREGYAATEQDINDFCLGRPPSKELLKRVTLEGTRDSEDAALMDPSAEVEILADIEKALYDPDLDGGVTRHKLVYWREALTKDRLRAKNHEEDRN